jgi:hypothetical protein
MTDLHRHKLWRDEQSGLTWSAVAPMINSSRSKTNTAVSCGDSVTWRHITKGERK